MFSIREEKIINIIGRKKLRINDITFELFREDKNAPFDSNITVSNSIRRIIKKCDYYKIGWTLEKNRKDGEILVSKVNL